MLIVPIHGSLLSLIGAVIVHWSNFERTFDEHLDRFIADAWSEEVDGKLSSQFTARKKLFIRLARRLFADHESIASYFERIAKESDDLRAQRDIIVHGLLVSHHPKSEDLPVIFTATGMRKGKAVTLKIDEDTLGRIWQQLAHLAGDLANCADTSPGRPHTLSLHDRSLLQAFVSKARQTPPRMSKLLDQLSTFHR